MISTFTASQLLDQFLALLPSGRAWDKTRTGAEPSRFVPPHLSETFIMGFSLLTDPSLLNKGYVFTTEDDSLMVQTIAPYLLSHERLYERAEELFVDIFPKSTEELLPEWESTLGLPDVCIGPNPSIAQRQTSVVARLVGRGGQNIPYFENLAVNLGYLDAYIQEFGPFLADIHGADAWAIMDNFYPYAWMVIAHSIAYADTVLVCELQSIRPANTELYFYLFSSTPNTNPQINTVYTQVPTPIVFTPGFNPIVIQDTSAFVGITLSQTTVLSQAPINTVVGTLTAQFSGSVGTVTFTLVNDDNGNFKISGNQLIVAKDTIAAGGHTVQIHLSSPSIITNAVNNFDVAVAITSPQQQGPNSVNFHVLGNILRPTGHAVTAFTASGVAGTRTNWYENPGQDGTFWKQPFYSSAHWITSGNLVTALRNGSHSTPTGVVNVKGDFAAPWVIGKSTDPLVTVTDGTKTIHVRIPLGTIIETPDRQFDDSIGGSDTTQPYLVWSISGATMNTNGVQSSGTVITGTYGFDIDDGSGPIMCDAVTGQPGTNNSIGGIMDFELTKIRTDPNYVIPHMLAYHLDKTTQVSASGPIWPLKVIDESGANTGPLPQGLTIGIPSTTVKPAGKTRGFYAWFDQLQHFGSFFYNVADSGATVHVIYSNDGANSAIVTDMQNTLSDVMQYVCILDYTNGSTGAQYSVATTKGKTAGAVNAYPAPPLLDYSPTNNQPVLPSTFGAWYPSGYNVPSTLPAGTTQGGGGTTATESVQGADVTTVGPQLFDSLLESFSISANGFIVQNGAEDTVTSKNVVELLYWNHNLYQKNNLNNWYFKPNIASTYVGPVADPRGVTTQPVSLTGQFSVQNGLIIDPNGNNFIARGININEQQLGLASNASGGVLMSNFPGMNFIRVACHSYVSATTLAPFIGTMTALGVVLIIEDHTGISNPPYTGSALTTETNWYSSIASNFISNPYVWFGTFNEPGEQLGRAAVTTQEVAIYNAIRNTGNTNPILMELVGGGNPGTLGTSGGLTASSYASMTNIVWDLHQYDWISGMSTSQATIASSLSSQFTLVQQITSADGIVPIIIGEYGISTDGDNVDPGGTQLCQAVQASGKGCAAWAWRPGGLSDNLTDGSNNLTSYGQQIAGFIKAQAAASGTSTNRIVAPLTGTITNGSWVAKDIAVSGVQMPSGKLVHFEYLLPANYNSSFIYPIMLWLHPDHSGDAWYLGQNTNPNYLSGADANGFYNNTSFRTKYPCISVVGYADQTNGGSSGDSAIENWGGWANNGTTGSGTNASGDTGPNTFAIVGVIKWILANLSADPSRVYVNGFSLGGIGSEYLMLKYNRVNGSQKIFTAGSSTGGVLEINNFGGPLSGDVTTMQNVPVWWVSGGNDNTSKPADWNLPMWRALAGNSNYPAPGGTAAQAQAGTSKMHFWYDTSIGHQQTNSSGQPYPTNTTILDWLFSQII